MYYTSAHYRFWGRTARQ